MLMSLIKQVDITARRVEILQSLPSMAGSAQVSATIYTEDTAHQLFGILAGVFLLVAPVNVLCTELHALASNVGSHMQHGHDHQQHRLQQGNNLISRVAAGLKDADDKLMLVYRHHLKARDGLEGRGNGAPGDVLDLGRCCEQCVGQASIVWLELLGQLPPSHKDTAQYFYISYVRWLRQECLSKQTITQIHKALCRVLAQPALLLNLQTALHPHSLQHGMQHLLFRFQVTAEQLQAAGMPAAQAQQLMSDADSNGKPDVTSVSRQSADTELRSSSSTADSSSEEGLCSEAGTDAGVGAGDGVADGG